MMLAPMNSGTMKISIDWLSICAKNNPMPDKDEKVRRKALLHSQREEKRRSIREGLPAPATMMKALFDYIDKRLSSSECDDSPRYATEFIRTNSLPEDAILDWLEEAGGYCDCEAINNAEQILEDAVPGYHDLPPPDGLRG
jgi:Protein of unknown function (DUF2695)